MCAPASLSRERRGPPGGDRKARKLPSAELLQRKQPEFPRAHVLPTAPHHQLHLFGEIPGVLCWPLCNSCLQFHPMPRRGRGDSLLLGPTGMGLNLRDSHPGCHVCAQLGIRATRSGPAPPESRGEGGTEGNTATSAPQHAPDPAGLTGGGIPMTSS